MVASNTGWQFHVARSATERSVLETIPEVTDGPWYDDKPYDTNEL